mgnify:CR=1 FL=1
MSDDNKNSLENKYGTLPLTNSYIERNNISFYVNPSDKPIMEFKENGDIYVKGKLVENDKEVVNAMREFLAKTI